jgi:pre-rRNA-processing protein TSR2
MLNDRPETDAEDLEEVLIQVMNDEFDVVIDDESAAATAVQIMNLRAQVARGDNTEVQRMWAEYREKEERKDHSSAAMFRRVEAREEDQETDEEEEDESEEDVEMDEAPGLVRTQQPREKVEPEVDEDGFTKVVGKKKR